MRTNGRGRGELLLTSRSCSFPWILHVRVMSDQLVYVCLIGIGTSRSAGRAETEPAQFTTTLPLPPLDSHRVELPTGTHLLYSRCPYEPLYV